MKKQIDTLVSYHLSFIILYLVYHILIFSNIAIAIVQ
jgi:hypothetical protein